MTLRIDRQSRGVYIIAATPFAEDGALDLESTDRMVDFYLSTGVTGMTIPRHHGRGAEARARGEPGLPRAGPSRAPPCR